MQYQPTDKGIQITNEDIVLLRWRLAYIEKKVEAKWIRYMHFISLVNRQ